MIGSLGAMLDRDKAELTCFDLGLDPVSHTWLTQRGATVAAPEVYLGRSASMARHCCCFCKITSRAMTFMSGSTRTFGCKMLQCWNVTLQANLCSVWRLHMRGSAASGSSHGCLVGLQSKCCSATVPHRRPVCYAVRL